MVVIQSLWEGDVVVVRLAKGLCCCVVLCVDRECAWADVSTPFCSNVSTPFCSKVSTLLHPQSFCFCFSKSGARMFRLPINQPRPQKREKKNVSNTPSTSNESTTHIKRYMGKPSQHSHSNLCTSLQYLAQQ